MIGCSNSTTTVDHQGIPCSLFRFPSNNKTRGLWKSLTERSSTNSFRGERSKATKTSRICHRHFAAQDYRTVTGSDGKYLKRRLKKEANPSFGLPAAVKPRQQVVVGETEEDNPSAVMSGHAEEEDLPFCNVGAPNLFSFNDCSYFAEGLSHQFPKINVVVKSSHILANLVTFQNGRLLCRTLLIQTDLSVKVYINSFKYHAADVLSATVASSPDLVRSMFHELLLVNEKIGLNQLRQTVVRCRNQLLDEQTSSPPTLEARKSSIPKDKDENDEDGDTYCLGQGNLQSFLEFFKEQMVLHTLLAGSKYSARYSDRMMKVTLFLGFFLAVLFSAQCVLTGGCCSFDVLCCGICCAKELWLFDTTGAAISSTAHWVDRVACEWERVHSTFL